MFISVLFIQNKKHVAYYKYTHVAFLNVSLNVFFSMLNTVQLHAKSRDVPEQSLKKTTVVNVNELKA